MHRHVRYELPRLSMNPTNTRLTRGHDRYVQRGGGTGSESSFNMAARPGLSPLEAGSGSIVKVGLLEVVPDTGGVGHVAAGYPTAT